MGDGPNCNDNKQTPDRLFLSLFHGAGFTDRTSAMGAGEEPRRSVKKVQTLTDLVQFGPYRVSIMLYPSVAQFENYA